MEENTKQLGKDVQELHKNTQELNRQKPRFSPKAFRKNAPTLSREALISLAATSVDVSEKYEVFRTLARLRNFGSANKVASLLNIKDVTADQAISIARSMLSGNKGTEGDRIIERIICSDSLGGLDEKTASALVEAIFLTGLSESTKLHALSSISDALGGRVSEILRRQIKFVTFRINYGNNLDLDLLKFAEVDSLDLENPSYQLKYISYLQSLGFDKEIQAILNQLNERWGLTNFTVFMANLSYDWRRLHEMGASLSNIPVSFFDNIDLLLFLGEHRVSDPLIDSMYEHSLARQKDAFRTADLSRKDKILRAFLRLGHLDEAQRLVAQDNELPNTLLPVATIRGLCYFKNNDYAAAKDCFLYVLEEDPSDAEAAQGLRFSLPRTRHSMQAFLAVRDRIGVGLKGHGRSGLGSTRSEVTTSLLMSGDYIGGLYMKRHAEHWQVMKSLYGSTFLNYEPLPPCGKGLFLIGDEGVGDEVRTAQFYGSLVDRFEHVTISCDPRLQSILQRSFPSIEFIPTSRFRKGVPNREINMQGRFSILNQKIARYLTEECKPALDRAEYITFGQNLFFNHYIGNLPRPAAGPYLRSQEARPPLCAPEPGKLKIGLLWRSHFRTMWREFMYLKIQDFAPLTEMQNIELWSVQHSIDRDELEFCRTHGIKLIEDVDLFDDFEGFAPYLAGMDLIIGISSLPIELAAALGTQVWMLGFSPENYFYRTKGGATDEDQVTLNSKIIAPQWIDFSAPRDECVDLTFKEVVRQLRLMST